MWQITLDELTGDAFRPKQSRTLSGTIYRCEICGAPVGIYGPRERHEHGWVYRRDKCENGHAVDWTGVRE